MKKRLNILILIAAAIALTTFDAMAQNSSSATMQVRVEVVNGSQITRNTEAEDSSIQKDEIVYGDFTMNLPEGVEFVTESGEQVEMTNGSDNWYWNAEMQVEREEDGEVNLRFVTNNKEGFKRSGTYHGTQMATIHYL